MALDHIRVYVGKSSELELWCTRPSYPNDAWQATRSFTHLCAPGFVFLMGVGIMLFGISRSKSSSWDRRRVWKHHMIQGILLLVPCLVLEIGGLGTGMAAKALLREASSSSSTVYDGCDLPVFTTVMLALGTSMLFLATTLYLMPERVWVQRTMLLLVAAVNIVGIQLAVDHVAAGSGLHCALGVAMPATARTKYTVVPCWGVASLGALFGLYLSMGRRSTKGLAVQLAGAGSLSLVAFARLRAGRGFGNFTPPEYRAFRDFVNVSKYPPSLCYLLLTLGVNGLLGGVIGAVAVLTNDEEFQGRIWVTLRAFGQAPLCFYISHLYFYGLVAFPSLAIFPQGVPLPLIYVLWLLGLVPLTFACRPYASFKSRKPANSWWRIF